MSLHGHYSGWVWDEADDLPDFPDEVFEDEDQSEGMNMQPFDMEANSIEDLLAGVEDEPELTDKKYRFKERVNSMMNHHNLREDAEAIVETVIRTKETDKRCKCGEVAQFVVKHNREIVCGKCRKARKIQPEDCL